MKPNRIAIMITMVAALFCFAFADVGNDVKVVELFPVLSRTTTVGTYSSFPVNRTGYHSAVITLNSAKSAAGTGTTFATLVQESDPLAVGSKETRSGTVVSKPIKADNLRLNVACKITQSGARQIYKASFWMRRYGTIASSKYVILQLQTNNSGLPSGTLVNSFAVDSLSATSMDTTFKFREFTFQRPIDVANSTIYHFVLTGDYSASTSNYIGVGVKAVASGGDFSRQDSAAYNAYSADTSVLGWDEQFNFSTISGQTTYLDTVTETSPVFATRAFNLRSVKPWIRVKATVAGTSADFTGAMNAILGEPTYKPAY